MSKLLKQYHDPTSPGSYGGVSRFVKSQGISLKKAKAVLEHDLGYTLHKPTRRKFPTLPIKVFTIDEQWTADLIEVINISKQNKGYKYLLTVVHVFFPSTPGSSRLKTKQDKPSQQLLKRF